MGCHALASAILVVVVVVTVVVVGVDSVLLAVVLLQAGDIESYGPHRKHAAVPLIQGTPMNYGKMMWLACIS